jgi:hypothetical protein
MTTTRTAAAALAASLLMSACAAGAPAPFDQGVRLEWGFVADRPFYQKTFTETSQKMKVNGNEMVTTQKQTLLFRWAPVRQLPDGSWVVKQKLQAIQLDIEVGGSKITYDSAKPAANNPLAAFYNTWLGTELTLTVSPRMKVTRVEGREALLRKVGKDDPSLKAMIEALLSENALKGMAQSLFAPLPGKSVKKGQRWTEESKLELGGLGSYTNRSHYLFEGPDRSDKRLGRIAVTHKLRYSAAAPGAGGALPFKVVRGKFKKSEGAETIWINLGNGRTERSRTTLRLGGRMTVEIGGANTDIDIEQTQQTTVTVSDVSPKETKERP